MPFEVFLSPLDLVISRGVCDERLGVSKIEFSPDFIAT